MVSQLTEMFPYTCDLEVNHCLTVTSGELERASQLIMHRHEGGQSLQPTDRRVSYILIMQSGNFTDID